MSEHNPYPDEPDHSVRLMVGDPLALAWAWLLGYVEYINGLIDADSEEVDHIDIDELINTAMGNADSADGWSDEWITRGGVFEGFSVDPTFWDKLADLKQIQIPPNNRTNFFSCSC